MNISEVRHDQYQIHTNRPYTNYANTRLPSDLGVTKNILKAEERVNDTTQQEMDVLNETPQLNNNNKFSFNQINESEHDLQEEKSPELDFEDQKSLNFDNFEPPKDNNESVNNKEGKTELEMPDQKNFTNELQQSSNVEDNDQLFNETSNENNQTKNISEVQEVAKDDSKVRILNFLENQILSIIVIRLKT